MAVTLLRVLVLGVIAAAADDATITWWPTSRAALTCAVPSAERLQRRPPPPLEPDDKARAKPYVWWRGQDEIKKVLPNGTLEVSRKKDGSTEGVYQCGARYHGGIVLGYPLHLKFAYFDKFTAHPDNSTARADQPFVLKCDINSRPAAVFAWTRDGEALPNDRFNVVENQLIITNVKKEDSGLYRCKATNVHLNKTKISHGGRLHVVEGSGSLELAFLPVDSSSSIEAARGSRVLLPCPISGWPRPTLKWEFTPPGDRTQELEDISEVLTLQHLDLDMEGVYTCSVEGNSSIAKTFNVTLTEPVQIVVPPVTRQTMRASTIRFNCTAIGRPTPTITWYKNGNPLDLTGRNAAKQLPSAGVNHFELLIRSVTSEDAGVYQCFANNSASSSSAWAELTVGGGEASAPVGVQCWPGGARSVLVKWSPVQDAVAYTVHFAKPGSNLLPVQPVKKADDIITVAEPLTPYVFQVRAYLNSKASDLSENVTCHAQGVPIKLDRVGDSSILVSWREFADQTPGVLQWMLQYKVENGSEIHNVTLGANAYNYTVKASKPIQVRVLGTKLLPWLHQNLTLVPWTSSTVALHNLPSGEVDVVPKEVEVVGVEGDQFTVRWVCEEADVTPELYTYQVCTRKIDGNEECLESEQTKATVLDLQPASEYRVRVRARAWSAAPAPAHAVGPFSAPLLVTTQPEGPSCFSNLSYDFVNVSSIRVSWSRPDSYTVHFTNEQKLPIYHWPSVETDGNTVLLTGLDLTRALFVVVVGFESASVVSPILEIPVQVLNVKDIRFSVSGGVVTVRWEGAGARVVRYSQNLTLSIDKWASVDTATNSVQIHGLDPSRSTYVMVTVPGPNQHSQVLNIPPQPVETSYLYHFLGLGCGVAILCLVVLAAICIWRRKKRSRSPFRSRRRNVSLTEGNEEEGAEMKSIGDRLANGGGPKDAGEPLLNGHVHITENPNQTKTPNGRMRKGRPYEPPLDVARYEDADTTLETVLDPDTSTSTTFHLLDTSRRPEYDVSRSSRDISANNSFHKLPDDNMNSELTRSTDFQLDNSKILPTLQPNG